MPTACAIRLQGDEDRRRPHPAVYVVDKSGKVAWAKVEDDFKQRPGNAEIRAALDALK